MYKSIVIEDERLIRKYIIDFINNSIDGFFVVADFVDGQDAIDYIKDNDVDLIITDIRMLEVSGIEVAKYVYENDLAAKVIIISGYQDFDYAKEAIKYNVRSYLTKPIDPMELKRILEHLKVQMDKENNVQVQEQHMEIGINDEGNYDEDAMIKRVLLYIEKNYNKDISLTKVADFVYLSEDYLGKVFKKNTGSSFTNYLLSMRMQKAIELLKTGRYTVNEISEMVGYKYSNYFIKLFHQYTGYTPKKYIRFLEEHHEN